MAILHKFMDLRKKDEEHGVKIKARHVAITTDGVVKWTKNNKKGLEEAYKNYNLIIKSTIKTQIKLRIPILTIYLLPSDMANLEHFSMKVDSLIGLFNELLESDVISENHIKISTFGKWYDLPGRVVEPIKDLLESTKDYDKFFVNCASCDREIEFGWSQPNRGGRIFPVECSDFILGEIWPEPRYLDSWHQKGWLRMGDDQP